MTDLTKAAREALETLRLARDRIVQCGGSGWKALATRCDRDAATLRAALSETPGEERAGWVLVPVEPTWDMKMAASTAYREPTDGHYTARMACAEDAYRAMLAARPEAQTVALTEEQIVRLYVDLSTACHDAPTPTEMFAIIVRAAIAKFCEVNGLAAPEAQGKEGGA